tara:strand:- start:1410 stop:2360 length:951 start_codon:yes stop_codon:yes gene_type:complete
MFEYFIRRIITLFLTLVIASIVIFVSLEIIPGDPASYMLGINAQEDTILALRKELGLDVPKIERYLMWVKGMLIGDFGVSYTYRSPVIEMVSERLWVSLPLAIYALILSTFIALPVGVYAAANRGKVSDLSVMGVTQIGIAIPNFWFAMLLVYLFAIILRWFSAGGFPGWETGIFFGLKSLTLPAISLALPQASILARVMRSSLIDTLNEDFIKTARAKGLSYNQALVSHGIRNALIPVLTIIGLQFSFLMAGAIIIENVFFLPGLGRLIFQSIAQRDIIVVESVIMLLVFSVVVVTFIVDIAYVIVDPRLRSSIL